MLTYSSNSQVVLKKHLDKLKQLRNVDKILRTAAFDMQATITSRVQQRGLLTQGGKIGGGKYSPAYAKKRRGAGKRTDLIDLTYEGDLMRSFIAALTGSREYSVGFDYKKEADKAEYLENHYGKIFDASKAEIKQSVQDIENAVAKILK